MLIKGISGNIIKHFYWDGMKRHIYLTGFMGSGKSTIGAMLAKRLGLNFIDTDAEIEAFFKKSVKDIFKEKGEASFREFEKQFVDKLSKREEQLVISLGGGALMSKDNIDKVHEQGILVYIKSSPEEIWIRINHSTRRPLMRQDGEDWTKEDYFNRIKELLSQREEGYNEADFVIEREGKEADEIVEVLVNTLNVSEIGSSG